MHRKQLHTFTITRKKKRIKTIASLETETRKVQKCMRCKIALINKVGKEVDFAKGSSNGTLS